MKKIMFAAITAGVLSLGAAPTVDAAVRVGIGPGGVAVKVGHGHRGWHKHRKCSMVKSWRHGRPVWIKKCWW